MDLIEWKRLITLLLSVSDLSAKSELLPASSKPSSTSSRHSFNQIENRFTKNLKNICLTSLFNVNDRIMDR